MKRQISSAIANSFIMSYPRKIHMENIDKVELPIKQKILANMYCLMDGYGKGEFPIKYDREKLFADEKSHVNIYNLDTKDDSEFNTRTPFMFNRGRIARRELIDTIRFLDWVNSLNLPFGSNALEIGCGNGWLSEIMCIAGFNVTATTLSEDEIKYVKIRSESLKVKGLTTKLIGKVSTMEEVSDNVRKNSYDLVFVKAALHHAYDWKKTIQSVRQCLKNNGYFIMFEEPSSHHNMICYRSSLLTGRHEEGFKKKELLNYLDFEGFKIIKFQRRFGLSMPISLIARKS